MDSDVLKEIPGYKAILKSVLKTQIQLLVEQLCDQAGEESIILTASLTDGSLSHMGSKMGKGFFKEKDEIKSQFLGYCLKSQHGEHKTNTNNLPQGDQSLDLYDNNPSSVKKKKYQQDASTNKTFENQSSTGSGMNINTKRRRNVQRNQPVELLVKISKPSVSTPVSDKSTRSSSLLHKEMTSKMVAVKLETDNLIPDANGTNTGDTLDYPNRALSVNDDHESDNDDYSIDILKSAIDGSKYTKMDSNIKVEPAPENEELDIVGGSDANASWLLGEQSAVSGTDVIKKPGKIKTSAVHKSKCQQCGKVLINKFSLRRHMLVHKDPQLCCIVCNKQFRCKTSLRHHVSSLHTGDCKHVCAVCCRRFPSAYHLRRHNEDVHLQIKRFQCDQCGKGFKRKETLQTHLLSHDSLKPFQCTTCKAFFKKKKTLMTHPCEKYLRPVPTCSRCNKTFKERKYLLQHEQLHREPKRQCFKCGKIFTWQASLSKHQKTCNK